MGTLEEDIASIIIRIEQIDIQKQPEHWLWDRVMTCDIPRLRGLLNKDVLERVDDVLGDIRESHKKHAL